MHKTIFITGTDTGVGKSVYTTFLALSYFNDGKKVAISKPIQTGLPKDTDFLCKLTGNKIPIFNSYTFSLPAAPVVAAQYENKTIEMEKIISDIKNLENQFDVVIVEGIGGIAVPIVGARHGAPLKVADLVKHLNSPVIIVARPTLGTINHTILTIEFAKQKKLDILGFVISGFDEKAKDLVIKTAPDVISGVTNVKCLLKLPFIYDLTYDSILKASNTSSCLANKAIVAQI